MVSKNSNYEPVKQQTKSNGSNLEPSGQSSGGVVCYYCHKLGHTRRECRKLLNRNRRFQSAHAASASNTLEQSVVLSADEYAKLLKPASTPTVAFAESGTPNTCLMSSSSNWVIDSGATYHMLGNSSLFAIFQSQPTTSTITLADGSKSCALGSDTINPTPLITLTSVLSLPHFSFNLISVSKLTRTLNCSISLFLGYCLFQDLLTKRVIDRGQEFRGLYILDPELPKPIACFGIAIPHEVHFCLGHPSQFLLKKLFPQFSSLSLLNCELCQYTKLHRVHLSPRVDKRASAHFELIHPVVWGPCSVMSPTGFKYFVTFVDDFSRVT